MSIGGCRSHIGLILEAKFLPSKVVLNKFELKLWPLLELE